MGLKGYYIRGSDRNIQVYSLWPYRMLNYKTTNYLWNYCRILSVHVTGSYCFFIQTSRRFFPCLWVGCTLQASLLGGRGRCFTQKLPASLGDQFAQSPATFYTLLPVKVHQSQSPISGIHQLCNQPDSSSCNSQLMFSP